MTIWQGDEIKCRSPNFVILRKNNILGLKHCQRTIWSLTIVRHILYRLQCRKIKWGHLNKVGSKKIFSLKTMTKLEDLTVRICCLKNGKAVFKQLKVIWNIGECMKTVLVKDVLAIGHYCSINKYMLLYSVHVRN